MHLHKHIFTVKPLNHGKESLEICPIFRGKYVQIIDVGDRESVC